MISQLTFETNKKLDPHVKEFSSVAVRKVEVMFYNDRSSDTAFLGTHRKFSKVPFCCTEW